MDLPPPKNICVMCANFLPQALLPLEWSEQYVYFADESEELKSKLADTRLQQLIQSIDTDNDREKVKYSLARPL